MDHRPAPSPVRAVATAHPDALTQSAAGDRLPLRYSGRLALVLSGGGARAAYQVGILSGLVERLPELAFPIVTGVSAGAINAATLASHCGPFDDGVGDLRRRWAALTPERVYRVRPGEVALHALARAMRALVRRNSPPANVRGVFDSSPLRTALRDAVDPGAIDANLVAGRLRAAALTATSFTTGYSVTFVQARPGTPMWQRALRHSVTTRLTLEHVMASAAIPLVFPLVQLDEAFYGDGGVRQTAPLAPALHLGARAILAVGLRSGAPVAHVGAGRYPSAAEVVSLLLDTVFLDTLEADAERLERVNRLLETLPAGQDPPDGLRPVNLLLVRPSRDLGTLAAGLAHRLPSRVRWVARRVGGREDGAMGFLSYLLFDPAYIARLMELGYDDVRAHWPAFETFFAKVERRL